MIKYKGTTLYPPALHNILNEFSAVENFVIELYHNSIGTDEICIKIGTNTPTEALLKSIKDHFRAKLRVSPTIEYLDIEEIRTLQFPKLSRKPVIIIDKRP